MKRFIAALLFTLIPFTVFAQNQGDLLSLGRGGTVIIGRVNENQTDLASSEGAANFLALTKTGAVYTVPVDGISGLSQSVVPVSNNTSLNGVGSGLVTWVIVGTDLVETASTTTVLNLTSNAARVGDSIVSNSGTAGNIQSWSAVCERTANTVTLCNALPATPAASDQVTIYRPLPVAGSGGTTSVSGNALAGFLDFNYQPSSALGLLKKEDNAHASGDAGVMSLSVQNDGWSTLAATGDYIPQAAGRAGNQYATLVIDDVLAGSHSPIRNEDAAFANLDPVVVSGGQALSAIAQSVGTSGDVAPPALDLGNRTVVTFAPTGETFEECSTSNTGTSDVAIKAAVASNRIYVTSLSCYNTSSVASSIIFKNGTTQIYVGGVSNSTLAGVGTWNQSFPVPLRTTANTALNFAMGTNSTATTCCAAGYISTI